MGVAEAANAHPYPLSLYLIRWLTSNCQHLYGFTWGLSLAARAHWTVPSWKCQGMNTCHDDLRSMTNGSWSINAPAPSLPHPGDPELHFLHASQRVLAASTSVSCIVIGLILTLCLLLPIPFRPLPTGWGIMGVTSPINYLYWNPYLGLCFLGYPNQHRA